MEIFFTNNIDGSVAILEQDECKHCIKVLRHKPGDTINFIDGKGGFYKGTIVSVSSNICTIEIKESFSNYSARPYYLNMAVAPTKNLDRYEWFMEKAVELGLDVLSPVVGEHSERKTLKPERAERIFLSAAKQSLKAKVPQLEEISSVEKYISASDSYQGTKIIAHCNDGEKTPIMEVIREGKMKNGNNFYIMIGPEGDFSPAEVEMAISHGFIPVTLGESRLRTETAALAAVAAVYFNY